MSLDHLAARTRKVLSPLILFYAFLFLMLLSFSMISTTNSKCKCILFNFGDSNTDTGGRMAGIGLRVSSRNGREFFHRSTGRYCDGRLYIDFICEHLKISFLSPYLESSDSNFRHGVNFAVSGAATDHSSVITFPLNIQVRQFDHFKRQTQQLREQGKGAMISDKEFHNALYSIDIGQNDLYIAFASNLTYDQRVREISTIVSSIRSSIQSLYDNGARKVLVYNTGPLGCLPQMLALYKTNDSELDSIGCLAAMNNAAKAFNSELYELCNKLRSDLQNATIVYNDIFSIKYDLIANNTMYGFENPLMACCGSGGPPYNYKLKKSCGKPGSTVCPRNSRYISWDGVHYTEAANLIIADKILSAKYSNRQIDLKSFCKD